MEIFNQKKVKLANCEEDMNAKKNPNLNSGIYLATSKVFQFIILVVNKRQKEEVKK